ncbi:hypothetical protein ACBQ19_14385 [Hafnia alvei]|uniref:hypothetical protein n=1 Tax=Hafnia alvei TaxID=569 RepID=UPI00266D1F2A|nr:hypothetical protein [Hafnia alvei]
MIQQFKDVASSAMHSVSERTKSPVLGAFALSWCAFNWKSLFYLFLSDTKIYDKIEFISANSNWKITFAYPTLSVIFICGFLPWANNLVAKWQIRPLINSDAIDNHRKAKQIQRSTRLQRLQAKHDVTYEKVKTGVETEIQGMKETILESQERMGVVTAERDKLQIDMFNLMKEHEKLNDSATRFSTEAKYFQELSDAQDKKITQLESEINSLNSYIDSIQTRYMKDTYKSKDMMSKTMIDNAKDTLLPG